MVILLHMVMHRKSLVDLDPWLAPFATDLARRSEYIDAKTKIILGSNTLDQFALGHLYYGLHHTKDGWVFREWAPNATAIYFVGEHSNWQDDPVYVLTRLDHGVWEIKLPHSALKHKNHYKLHVHWPGGEGYRIPSYARYVVQDKETKDFDAVVWDPPNSFKWTDDGFEPAQESPLIYEAHVGMSGEKPEVSSYHDFTRDILPRIKQAGYNTIQLMAVQEHPYYGSFGYHVSNFFAASSRFGTPDDLKHLVNAAHKMGLRVILDIVHSHAVRNEAEGLSRFDGTYDQYFYPGERGEHSAWDSRCFDYGKPEVVHFLLSNCRFWLDEYHFDGYRFDGVTSMLYSDHGLDKAFTSYDDYFGPHIEKDALAYLTLANRLVHTVKPSAITIAEDMSALPGIAGALDRGGIGFDYRLSMGMPDLWIKTLKEKRDEDWDMQQLFHELTTHRPEERTISYVESHDQALVGDKTVIFRLIDKEMYYHMQLDDPDLTVERGIALHKLIRLLTASTNGGGYLNFMGNEFGHPEWIDFPREGNDWSYHYARRQWSLADNPKLKYQWLGAFDRAMIDIVRQLDNSGFHYVHVHDSDKIISFVRSGYVFVFNFSPDQSYTTYGIQAPVGEYHAVLSSDNRQFGGQNRIDTTINYTSDGDSPQLMLYLPARTALVLKATD